MADCLDLLAQKLEFVFKESEQRETLELLLRGKVVFCDLSTALFIRYLFMQSSSSSVQRPTVIVRPCYLACVKKGDRSQVAH